MYGRNILAINWSITDLDLKLIEETSIRFISKWNSLNTILPNLEYIPLKDSDEKPYDAYHPVGTCRMGYDAESTVDQNLKVRGLENAWVVSTGVLPSAGSANPTFTMLCMANHLAKQLLNNKNYSRDRDIK
jgi:choline dehydrogenase-like flavoprotein